jgi:glycosyltransferase involved in cell wall biosynthesis
MKPLVSVMICTNQVDDYFDLALTSIEKQSLSDIEILIVANCLTEGQKSRLAARATDPRVRLLHTDMSGVTFSRNMALHAALADLIAVLDADDIAYADRLKIQYDFMISNPAVTVLGSNYDTIDQHGNKIAFSNLPAQTALIREKLVWSNPVCHPTTMFRRQSALSVGGYTGGLAQDYELWLSLMTKPDCQFVNLSQALIGYRVPVVSKARRSRRAYAQVASAQWRQFVLTKSLAWFAASVISVAKAWFRARQD